MILDGEIVALDAAGRPSFHALQNRAQLKTPAQIEAARRETPVVLVCFDLLHFAGLNLRAAPYLDRRRYLSQCLLPAAHLQLVHSSTDAEELYDAALKSRLRGHCRQAHRQRVPGGSALAVVAEDQGGAVAPNF